VRAWEVGVRCGRADRLRLIAPDSNSIGGGPRVLHCQSGSREGSRNRKPMLAQEIRHAAKQGRAARAGRGVQPAEQRGKQSVTTPVMISSPARTVVVFSLPGAFTHVLVDALLATTSSLPFFASGVTRSGGMSVKDEFVMNEGAKDQEADNVIHVPAAMPSSPPAWGMMVDKTEPGSASGPGATRCGQGTASSR